MSDEFFDEDEHVAVRHPGSHYQPTPQVAVGLLIAFIISLVAVFHYVNPISANGHAVTTTVAPTTTTIAGHPTTTVPRGQVKVQVANGTTIAGLARTVTVQLQVKAWGVLQQIQSPQPVSATVIYYRLGFQWAARKIASEINVSQSSVQQLKKFTGVPGYNIDDVIVLLGLDASHG
jgi:hypothetical protein